MSLTFTILGCGSSMGVPRVALGWGECDPNNPKNRRRRCSPLVERKSIDDLRPLFVHKRRRVDVYLDEPTSRAMHARFGYCFMTPPGSEYPPILNEKRLVSGEIVTIDGQGGPIEVLPVLQNHGDIPSLGFRF